MVFSVSAMRILVTGGAGFIGSHLVDYLNETIPNLQVTTLDDLSSGDLSRIKTDTRVIRANLTELTSNQMLDIVSGNQIIFHLAARKHNIAKHSPDQLIEANISATAKLLIAARTARVKKFVFTSSLYVYGSGHRKACSEDSDLVPNSVYGASKLLGEAAIQTFLSNSEVSWNILRLYFAYGPGQFAEGGYKSVIVKTIEKILRNEPPTISGDGQQQLDYVYVDDVVKALSRCALTQLSGKIWNVASGKPTSVRSLISEIQNLMKTSFEPVYTPIDETHNTFRVGDSLRIQTDLNWHPQVDLQEGLHRTIRSIATDLQIQK